MITGLPVFKPPIVESVYCHCRRVYHVFVGVEDYQARFAEKEALGLGARFVDARYEPFITCACGQVLDFAPEVSMMIQ